MPVARLTVGAATAAALLLSVLSLAGRAAAGPSSFLGELRSCEQEDF
jgi:hypothetical protein